MRKKIKTSEEYCVTSIGYCVGGDIEKAKIQAQRAGELRADIWEKYGSLQAWGKKADDLYRDFQLTNPPSMYKLDFKQWQQTFNRVIDDIHASQDAARSFVIRKIYRNFDEPEMIRNKKGQKTKEQVNPEEPNFRTVLLYALSTLDFLKYPLLHRWVREYYHRGYTQVDNQICVGSGGNGAKVTRKSKNVVTVEITGDKLPGKKNKYEKISLDFKVGRITPKGNIRIIYNKELERFEIHFSKIVKIKNDVGSGKVGVDKGFTEAFYDSNGNIHAPEIGLVMKNAVSKRHKRGKARNHLWQLAQNQNKPHILKCNLGKKHWTIFENRKKARLKKDIRSAVNNIFDDNNFVVAEDLTAIIKGKKLSKRNNRNLSEWCKGELQKSLDEIAARRGGKIILVNAAYSSQVDCRNGTLLGSRQGDLFFTFDGGNEQSDYNAALTILNRASDTEITLYMKFDKVHEVLLRRTASFLMEMGLTLQDAVEKGWLDSKHLKKKSRQKGMGKSESLVA